MVLLSSAPSCWLPVAGTLVRADIVRNRARSLGYGGVSLWIDAVPASARHASGVIG